MPDDLPSGTVTFLFTDVEGSTRLLHALGAEAYAGALAEHRRVIREACAAEGGVEVDTQGDAFFFAFPTAPGALAAASAFTEALRTGPIQVRVGLHTGTALVAEEGYVGDDVHFAARVAATSHGGQVVLSASTAELVEVPLTDLGSHRLKDITEAVSIFQLGDGSFPPLKTIANSNLPTPASSFLGREEELYEAGVLLQQTRLLTISGPGGQGKTRFALELAIRAREERFSDYPDGVFSCFLSSLRDPSLVLPAIAQTLGAAEQPGRTALEALAVYLRAKKLLLLLDNLEHLLEAAFDLAQLLQRAEGLALLITSRERLRIRGEEAYALPPLPEQEGIALFCERSKLAPSQAIAEIASRLEGLPLAIELAAARTTILTPTQLLERLSSRLDLLKGGRDADPRQRTLRATIGWSHGLLTAEEQRLFAALSVFQGGCTLEAAEEVAGADLDLLQSLVDKSLLRFTEERFWMLETIREFAAEQLESSGRAEEAHLRAAAFVVALAERAEPQLGAPDAATWIARLVDEDDNIRGALAWLLAAGRYEPALRLCVALRRYWTIRGRLDEGLHWTESALIGADSVTPELRLRSVAAASVLTLFTHHLERSHVLAEMRLNLARELQDAQQECDAINVLAILAGQAGDEAREGTLLRESLALARGVNERSVLFGLINLGSHEQRRGASDAAAELYAEAIGLARRLGDKEALGAALSSVVGIELREGRLDDARTHLRECLALAKEIRHVMLAANALGKAAVALDGRRPSRAATMLGAREHLMEEASNDESDEVVDASVDQVRTVLGADGFDARRRIGRKLSLDEAVEYALASLD